MKLENIFEGSADLNELCAKTDINHTKTTNADVLLFNTNKRIFFFFEDLQLLHQLKKSWTTIHFPVTY